MACPGKPPLGFGPCHWNSICMTGCSELDEFIQACQTVWGDVPEGPGPPRTSRLGLADLFVCEDGRGVNLWLCRDMIFNRFIGQRCDICWRQKSAAIRFWLDSAACDGYETISYAHLHNPYIHINSQKLFLFHHFISLLFLIFKTKTIHF